MINELDFNSPNLSVRVVDEASKTDRIEHFLSHLRKGVLSYNEMRVLRINPKLSCAGACRMETLADEISVYGIESFKFWRVAMNYSLGLFIDAPLGRSQNPEIDHPVIKDSVPVGLRKIVGVYLNQQIVNSADIIEILNREKKILPVYDFSFNKIN